MSPRPRLALGVLAALVFVVAAAITTAAVTSTRDDRPAAVRTVDAPVVRRATVARASIPRPPRVPELPVLLALAAALAVSVATRSSAAAPRPVRWSLGDVGDTWRSLLRGAPPARA